MTIQSPCQRTAPFLHRNWLKGLKPLHESSVMGNIISSPTHKGPQLSGGDGNRPAKRRRVSSPDSFEADHLIAAPRAADAGSVLRIEVLKVHHKDSKKVRSAQGAVMPRDVLTTKAICRISIRDLNSSFQRVLHCQSQLCDLTTYKNPVGPHRVARVDLPRPFYVPQESILVNRPDTGRFELSDNYGLSVEFESANGGVRWPPLNPQHDFGITEDSLDGEALCVLSSQFDNIVGRLRQPLALIPSYHWNRAAISTNYIMEIDLRWGSGLRSLKQFAKDSKPCITAIDPDADPYSDANFEQPADEIVNGVNGHANGDATHDPYEELGGDQTPSRSLRTREKSKIYNLKVLSDQAQGRERKRRAQSASHATNEGRVQYLLPAEQPVCLDFYRCINCGAYHESMSQLTVHLQMVHPAYEYVLETTSQGPLFRVSALGLPPMTPSKTGARQPKVFNLSTLTMGDLSSSARAVQDDDLFRSPSAKAQANRAVSGSPAPKLSKLTARRATKAKNKTVLVPNIAQPLFHPISKAKLQPGHEVPETAPDDTWLIQKHQESISEFSDVDAAEKEYIWEWDGYILRKSITSAAYFPPAWLEFVQEKATWLVAEDHRMIEFGKHSSVLLARDLLDNDTMKLALSYIHAARSKSQPNIDGEPTGEDNSNRPEAASRQSPRSMQIRKSSSGCSVCQLPVLGPTLLVCANKVQSLLMFLSSISANITNNAAVDSPALVVCTIRRVPREAPRSQSHNETGFVTCVVSRKSRVRSPTFYEPRRSFDPRRLSRRGNAPSFNVRPLGRHE
ncbi:urease accessory protein [Purpureocillium lavendulum]|uniref:Urease accessory protein n=1 Tax=Purpureocillium lavendulum TaxID=1247861 RepID=A0AB34FP01_9HYPO|nr:urease accessory protein [Purpureocillium lavendulum]